MDHVSCKHCGDKIPIDKAIYVNATGKRVPNPSCEACYARSLREPFDDGNDNGKPYKHLRTGNWH